MSQNAADLTQHAMSLLASNRLAEARLAFIEICKLTPDDAQTWVAVATISGQLGMTEEAKSYLQSATDIEPDHEQAYLALALILTDEGDHINALDKCERALSIDTNYPEAWLAHSAILGKLGRYEDAATSARRAIELEPGMADAHVNLGNSLDASGQYDAAIESYIQAINLEPNLAKAHIALAGSQTSQGFFEDAKATCTKARQLTPNDPGLTCIEARIHEHEGRYQEAYDILQPLIGNEAFDTGAAITLANTAKRLDHSAEAVDILESMLQQSEHHNHNRRHIHMALAHLYDALGFYDKAFQNLEQGKLLATESFDPNIHRSTIDRYIKYFSAARTSTLASNDNDSELPIFIVGMPRSGTTLTEQILSCHPNIEGAGELIDINKIVVTLGAAYPTLGYPECLGISVETLTEQADRYIQRLRHVSADALRIIDKMPGNYLHLGLIQQLFPRARIIHCVRDPIDTCLSGYFQSFRNHNYLNNLRHLGMYYVQYARLMKHWRSVLRLPILDVRYEDMVEDVEAVSKQIIEFCGLPWDDKCLHFHKSKRTVMTASYQQVKQPIYRSSVQRWRHYENHLQPLLEELRKDPSILSSY